MSAQQMMWASRHDWYRGASLKEGKYTIFAVDTSTPNNMVVPFNNFRLLQAWAGY